MIEFLGTYAPQIAQVSIILSVFAPFIRKRIVSDRNMVKVFDNVKTLSKSTNAKTVDIKLALGSIYKVIGNIQMENEIQNKKINESILAFTQDELYSKMLNGLAQLDEMNKIIEQKDQNIQSLQTTIKAINRSLGVIVNDRKL